MSLTLKVYLKLFSHFLLISGITRTKEASELLYARQKFVATVKSAGMQAIDLVFNDYKGWSIFLGMSVLSTISLRDIHNIENEMT